MARHEADREDLFAELVTAMARWELQIPGWECPVITGLRPQGIWSIYFSADRCYHFDAEGGLRRAYIDGVLYRSAGTSLTRLVKQRSETETTLLSRNLTDGELAELLATLRDWIGKLRESLIAGHFEILRRKPENTPADQLIGCCNLVLTAKSPLSAALVDRPA